MNSKGKRITAWVAAIAAAALAFWIVRGGPSRADLDSPPDAAADSRAALQAETESGAVALDADGVGTARVDAASPAPASRARDESSTVTIEIVRGDTLAPVPSARVLFWPARVLDHVSGGFESWLRASAVDEHVAEALESRADEGGIAKVYDAVQGGTVVATSDGLWGRATIERGEQGRVSVRLAPLVSLAVRVVDTSRAPVPGVTVVLRQLGHADHQDLLSARSDAQGLAILENAGLWWDSQSPSSTGFVVAVSGLLDPPCQTVLDREAVAAGIIELVLEPSGSCAVELVDEMDRKLPTSFEVRACILEGRARDGVATPCARVVSSSDEVVVFEHVALGREVSLEVTCEGALDRQSVTGAGPRQPGERVRFRVRVQTDGVSVSGRIVDAQGAPLGGLTLSARAETTVGRRHAANEAWSRRTNEAGRFRFELRARYAPEEDVQLALSARSGTDGRRVIARRALPRDLSVGSHDLGDITLEDAPLLAAGIVVDTDGNPVAEALICASVPILSVENGDGAAVAHAFAIYDRSDAVGRFTLRGETEPGDVALHASKAGHGDRLVTVGHGSQTLRIVLRQAGSLVGQVLLDPSLSSTPVLVSAVLPHDPTDYFVPWIEPAYLAAEGGFVLRDVGAGAYSVRVLHAATGYELGRVDHVIVEGGRESRDARLDPLDLRASLCLIELELVDGHGAPVRGGSCSSRVSDDPAAQATVTHASGARLSLLYAGRPLEVSVSAPGFRSAQLEQVSEGRRVVLLSAARVRLELAHTLPALPPGVHLAARLMPADANRPPNAGATLSGGFDERGVVVCDVAFVGEASIDLLLVSSDVHNPRVESLRMPRFVRIEAYQREQSFRLDFDIAELIRAIEAMRSDR